MSYPDNALLADQCAPDVTLLPVARRINVAVDAAMLAAIDRIIDNEQVTLTEAVRRLFAYGDFVYEVTKQRGSTLFVRDSRGNEHAVSVL